MKKLIILSIGLLAIIAVFAINVQKDYQNNTFGLALANVEALATEEGDPDGWLWFKTWADCLFGGKITITSTGGGFYAGMVIPNYSAEILAQVQAAQVTYTLIPAQDGRKSYCYNGWNPFCGPDDCR